MQNNMENIGQQMNTNPALLKLRCPDCLKLYSVDSSQVTERRPQFKCVACDKKFWISFPEALEAREEILGFPLDWLESTEASPAPGPVTTESALSAKTFSCPNCTTPYVGGDKECASCGIIFEKFVARLNRKPQQDFAASKEVRELWENVLNNYDNSEGHQNFVRAAWADKSLEYAAQKYAVILQVSPQDEFARRAQKEIEALMYVRFQATFPVKEIPWKGWGLQLRRLPFTNIIIVLCGFIITTGIFVPDMRNLVGFGSSILFFIFALRYYFRTL